MEGLGTRTPPKVKTFFGNQAGEQKIGIAQTKVLPTTQRIASLPKVDTLAESVDCFANPAHYPSKTLTGRWGGHDLAPQNAHTLV